jgi:hypothetical protein
MLEMDQQSNEKTSHTFEAQETENTTSSESSCCYNAENDEDAAIHTADGDDTGMHIDSHISDRNHTEHAVCSIRGRVVQR